MSRGLFIGLTAREKGNAWDGRGDRLAQVPQGLFRDLLDAGGPRRLFAGDYLD